MLTLNKLYSIIDEYAPFNISKKLIEEGSYDNSGILINCNQQVENVLFTLDLTINAVRKAKALKCDTVVTHHPAIYSPLKQLGESDPVSAPVMLAIKNNINVISAHLNLDLAKHGTDYYLAKGCGANDIKVIETPDYARGYGSEFAVDGVKLGEFVKRLNGNLKTNRTLVYGNKNLVINKVASFCGAGGSHAINAVKNGLTDADVIVTSDLAHHEIKDLIELGKALVIPTHYASENYGFNKFYVDLSDLLQGQAKAYYFDDKRFL